MEQHPPESNAASERRAGPADYLARLIAIERQARKSESAQELKFTMVNWSHRLVPYYQAVLCEMAGSGKPEATAVSGVAAVEANTPFALWMSSFAREIGARFPGGEIVRVCRDEFEGSAKEWLEQWEKWLPGYLLVAPLTTLDGTRLGLLLFFREQPFQPQEASLLEVLAETYSHAWISLGGPKRQRGIPGRFWKFVFLTALALLICSFVIRVPETVLAPAEIVPQEPIVIAAPVAGQIKSVDVVPYSVVHQEQPLFRLDDTELRNQLVLAEKGLEVVKADYLRAEQKAFYDPAAKGDLEVLRLQVREKQLQVNYFREELARQEVRAPQAGLVIFRDRNDWIGRPVAVGERVMTLTDPLRSEIEISMPVDDAISLEIGARVRLFLRTDPLHPLAGEVVRTSYRAEEGPGGAMFFTLKAKLDAVNEQARIGLQGTAKVYGDSVSLMYYLFRKPLAVARRHLGM